MPSGFGAFTAAASVTMSLSRTLGAPPRNHRWMHIVVLLSRGLIAPRGFLVTWAPASRRLSKAKRQNVVVNE